jgi:nucleoside-diphosphate-sugar epimerase
MRVVIAGVHGRVARRIARLLCARGEEVVGIVRTAEAEAELGAEGLDTVVLDLEHAGVDHIASFVVEADAVVWAAGAGPGGDSTHRYTADRAAAVLLADAAKQAGVRTYLLVSSMGVDSVAGGATPAGVDEVFTAYLRAKLAAEEALLARPGLAVTVLRPGGLTDDPGTGRVTLARSVPRGSVPRDDVAAVLAALLGAPRDGAVLELVSGPTPVAEAVRSA